MKKSAPTLQKRMLALHARLEFYAAQYRKHGETTMAAVVETDAGFIKDEIDAYNKDLAAALDDLGATDATAETDLYAGHREPVSATEAMEAQALASQTPPSLHAPKVDISESATRAAAASVDKVIDDCKKEIPPGTWGWLTLPGQLIRRRAYTSMQGGQLIYIDEAGAHWHKSLIDSSPRASFEPDEKLGPAGSAGATIKPDDKDKEISLLKATLAVAEKSISLTRKEIERCKLFDWIKDNVGNIDFEVKVPKDVFSSNPWIAMGHNFESAVAKARDALNAVIKKGEPKPFEFRPIETAPQDVIIRILAYYKGVGRPISGLWSHGRFYPDNIHGSAPVTHWMPMPENPID